MSTEPQTIEPEVQEFDTPNIMSIAGGHFVHDTFSAFVSPLLPLLIEKLSLSLTLAGTLSIFTQLPSLLSVLIGYIADRVSVRYLVIFAPAITATLVTMIGFAPTYTATALLLFSLGISIMAFHAPAPAMIAEIAGNKVGRGMSIFMAGGELGRAVGPLLVGFGVTQWGMTGLWRLMFFGWIATIILFFRLKDISAKSKRKNAAAVDVRKFARLFGPLFAVMIFRNLVVNGLSVFMVVYLVSIREMGLAQATTMLAIYELAGVVGALSGGTLSDRFGRKQTVMGAVILTAAFTFLFINTTGILAYPVLMLLGLVALSVTPVFQALVQDQLPENRATASGMFILYAFITRAINVLLIGFMGDALGLTNTFMVIIVLSLISIPFIFTLPDKPNLKRVEV